MMSALGKLYEANQHVTLSNLLKIVSYGGCTKLKSVRAGRCYIPTEHMQVFSK